MAFGGVQVSGGEVGDPEAGQRVGLPYIVARPGDVEGLPPMVAGP